MTVITLPSLVKLNMVHIPFNNWMLTWTWEADKTEKVDFHNLNFKSERHPYIHILYDNGYQSKKIWSPILITTLKSEISA